MISITLSIEEIASIYELLAYCEEKGINSEHIEGLRSLKAKVQARIYLSDKNINTIIA